MNHWFSPFPIQPSFQSRLNAAGISQWTHPDSQSQDRSVPQPPEGGVLLLYDSPDRLLTLRSHSSNDSSAGGRWLSLSDLASGYRQLLELRSTGRLFSIWRLERLEEGEWLSCLHGDADLPAMDPSETPASLEAAVISRLLEARPEILSLYQDLELNTEVGRGKPHTTYMNDLRNQYLKDPELLLQDFQRQHHDLSSGMPTKISELEASLSITKEDCIARAQQVEMAMLQITQLQNHIDLVSGEDAFENDELKESLEASMQQTQLLVLQLAQVEEELIRQHKEASSYRELMSAQSIQIRRACQLMHSSAGWEGMGSSSGGASIEVLALLEGYRHSLKRAERLLSGEPG